jgi:ubiquinone/menaquinone biosynthesis C-methylase UbiE
MAKLELLQNMGFDQKGRLLDVGCGTGISVTELQELDVSLGIDISIKMLEIALSRGMEVVQADMTSLPIRPESFDRVMLITSFHHAVSKKRTAREILRILRDGGLLGASFLRRANGWRDLGTFVSVPGSVMMARSETGKDVFLVLTKRLIPISPSRAA